MAVRQSEAGICEAQRFRMQSGAGQANSGNFWIVLNIPAILLGGDVAMQKLAQNAGGERDFGGLKSGALLRRTDEGVRPYVIFGLYSTLP
jgi:hypothetical protein